MPYESDTRRALKTRCAKAAENDRFGEVTEQLRAHRSRPERRHADQLETYRKQIVASINRDIVQRHGYMSGVIAHSLANDKEIARAGEVLLRDTAEYRRITTEQDTERK